jgi:hypothetical protein
MNQPTPHPNSNIYIKRLLNKHIFRIYFIVSKSQISFSMIRSKHTTQLWSTSTHSLAASIKILPTHLNSSLLHFWVPFLPSGYTFYLTKMCTTFALFFLLPSPTLCQTVRPMFLPFLSICKWKRAQDLETRLCSDMVYIFLVTTFVNYEWDWDS